MIRWLFRAILFVLLAGQAAMASSGEGVEQESLAFLEQAGARFMRDGTGRVHAVCLFGPQFADVHLRHVANIPTLELVHLFFTDTSAAGLQHLQRLEHLKGVTLLGVRFTSSCVRAISTLTSLELLQMHHVRLYDDSRAVLGEEKHNQYHHTSITDEDLALLARLPHLRMLALRGMSICGTGFASFSPDGPLEKLSLGDSTVNDKGVEAIVQLESLISLDLKNTAVTDASIQHLCRLAKLQVLDLYGVDLRKEALSRLRELRYLRSLNLDRSAEPQVVESLRKAMPFTRITQDDRLLRLLKPAEGEDSVSFRYFAAFAYLASFRNAVRVHAGRVHLVDLRSLEDAPTPRIDSVMQFVGDLTDVHALDLSGTRVSDRGIACLRHLEQVEAIDLADTCITDESLKVLAKLTTLRALRVDGTLVSDEGVAYLTSLPRLETLELRGCLDVTDKSIESLAKMRALVELDLVNTGVSGEGLDRLCKLLPNTKIHAD